MHAELRRQKILDLITNQDQVLVKNLVAQFDTSEVTIRNDLKRLEQLGHIERFHGGAQLSEAARIQNSEYTEELQVDTRQQLNRSDKERIAEAAAKYIEQGNSLIFDSGSTTYLVAKEVAKQENLIVITNNLLVAKEMALNEQITLVLCGGTYRKKTRSVHGIKAEQCLEGVSADILFIGADGIDPKYGITTFNTGHKISGVMADCAKTIIAVIDSSKIGRVGYNKVLNTNCINTLITDTGISIEDKEAFEAQSIEVITV